MNEMKVARGLGWFSIGLGLTEIVAGKLLCRMLGIPESRDWVFRAYGVREIGAGVGILATENPKPWLWARVAGDVLDVATVASAYREDNPKKENVAAAVVTLLGITVLDYWCAKRLSSGRPHGSIATHRSLVADGSAPHYATTSPAQSKN